MTDNRFADCPNVRSVVFQAIGAGSACWSGGTRDAVFEAEEAENIGEEAMARIARILGLDGWKGSKMFGRYEIGEGIGEQ